MKAQAQARRNARNSTLPSSRTNLYSQSISLSSTKFFQKFDQIMFASPKREKSHEVAPVSKEIPEKPKAFQKEIEDRFDQVSARKSYNFPRSPQKEQNTEIQQTSSSDSSTNSLKQTTVYNLYAQNPGSQNPFSPKLPSVLMGEPFKQRSPNREALKGKVRINISEEDMSINVNKDEGNIDDSSKKLSGNNTPSSYRKLVSLIEVQLNRLPEQKSVDTPKDSLQQNLTKTWLGMISTSSRHTNQDFCTSGSGFLLSPSVGAGSIDERKSVKAPVEEPQGHTLGEKPQQRDIDKIGKSSYYLRASSRARQAGDVSDSKGLRDGKSHDKSNSRDGEPKSFMKVLGVRNLNCNSTTLSSWDFSLIKAANAKRSVSPKTNMAVVNANKISLKSSNKDEGSYKAEPIKILDEEDQERLFREYAKGANTQMRKRSRENNLSLVPEDVGKMNLNEMRKRKNVNSVSHLPGSDFSKVLKAGLISPPRDGNRDNVSRQEVLRSVVKKTEKKRMNSNGIENRVPVKMEKSQGNISGEHRKGQKSTEKRDSSNKGQRNANSPHRIGKFRGNETPLMMPFGRTQQYSLFKEENDGRDRGTCTTVSKNTLLRNLFLNRVRK